MEESYEAENPIKNAEVATPADNDGSVKDPWYTNAFYYLRRLYIPTSPQLLLDSQKTIFQRFVK